MVQNGEIPPGGLEQVEFEVMKAYESVTRVDLATLITAAAKKDFYMHFLCILMTAICVRVSQGRMLVKYYSLFSSLLFSIPLTSTVKAIRTLLFSQRHDIRNQFSALSNLLKTGASFGFQPVVFDETLLMMLSYFLEHVRPLLRAVLSRADLEARTGYLFPDWVNVMTAAPSDLIQRFCALLGLSITANGIRCLWEMKVEWMYQHGRCAFLSIYSFIMLSSYLCI